MQAVSLASPLIWADDLQAKPLVRRLDLETNMSTFFEMGTVEWQAFSRLETLRLCAWSYCNPSINNIPLELAKLHSLRHLHIENWSPKSINVIACCRVYATWRHTPAIRTKPQVWLHSPCWTSPRTKLVSLQVDVMQRQFAEPNEIRAIMSIVECHAGLESVRVTASRLGSEGVPFLLPILCSEGRTAPLKAEIKTSHGCWLGLTETLPSNKAFILNIQGPLHVGLPATREVLKWYALQGCSASNISEGASSLEWQLAKALSPAENTIEEAEVSKQLTLQLWIHGSFRKTMQHM